MPRRWRWGLYCWDQGRRKYRSCCNASQKIKRIAEWRRDSGGSCSTVFHACSMTTWNVILSLHMGYLHFILCHVPTLLRQDIHHFLTNLCPESSCKDNEASLLHYQRPCIRTTPKNTRTSYERSKNHHTLNHAELCWLNGMKTSIDLSARVILTAKNVPN